MANTFKFGNGNWAVKDGYALAYNDENNNFKPLPFDFTRASSATTLNRQGLIETVGSGKPRIDFTDNTSGHLLLEPSRTNVLPYSEEIDNAGWSKNNTTITANQIISPDGSQTADKYTHSGSTATNYIFENGFSVSSGTEYTFSVFVKKGTTDFVQLLLSSATFGTLHQNFDINNGIIGSSSGNPEPFIEEYPNDWFRIGITDTATTTGIGSALISLARSNTENRIASFSSSQYFYLWGAQFETGSYATSYIPTEGSSETRVAETCKQDLSQVVSSNTHTFYIEGLIKHHYGVSDGHLFSFSSSDTSVGTAILFYRGGNKIKFYGQNGGTPLFGAPLEESGTSDENIVAKYALAIENNRLSIYRNGTKIISSTATQTIPTNLKWLQLDFWNGQTALHTATYKDLRYYNTALTDTELQNLTS